jgi:hypothetical protein
VKTCRVCGRLRPSNEERLRIGDNRVIFVATATEIEVMQIHHRRDIMTGILVDEAEAAIVRGEDLLVPEAVWQAIETGEGPVKVLRTPSGDSPRSTTAP